MFAFIFVFNPLRHLLITLDETFPMLWLYYREWENHKGRHYSYESHAHAGESTAAHSMTLALRGQRSSVCQCCLDIHTPGMFYLMVENQCIYTHSHIFYAILKVLRSFPLIFNSFPWFALFCISQISTETRYENELKQSYKQTLENREHIWLRCWGDYKTDHKNEHYWSGSSSLHACTCWCKYILIHHAHSISFTIEDDYSRSNSSPQLAQCTHEWQVQFLAQGSYIYPKQIGCWLSQRSCDFLQGD